jgi:hypothetical protein
VAADEGDEEVCEDEVEERGKEERYECRLGLLVGV